MSKDNWASISCRPLKGTAKMVQFPSIIPAKKDKKEVFWIKSLITNLEEFKNKKFKISSNKSDDHGKDDVIIELEELQDIGVQVTELIYDSEYARISNRTILIEKILKEIKSEEISSDKKVIIKINSKFKEIKPSKSREIKKLVSEIVIVLERGRSNESFFLIHLDQEE